MKLDLKCVLVIVFEVCVIFCLQESEDDHNLPPLNLLICLVARFDSLSSFLQFYI